MHTIQPSYSPAFYYNSCLPRCLPLHIHYQLQAHSTDFPKRKLTATVPASAPTVMSNTAGLMFARPGAPRTSLAAPTTSSSLMSYGQLSRQYGTKPKYSERGPDVRKT
jgi:hypothetical protein